MQLEDAVQRGATVAFGGAVDREKLLMEPTTLLNVPAGAAVLENEIFGPVLPIIGYDDPAEAIEFIQAHTKPLALYIYSKQQAFVDEIVENTTLSWYLLTPLLTPR